MMHELQQFLLFRLYGTLVSWGDITVGEIRPTAAYPSKSAIVGLVAAAFGYKREQEQEIQTLSGGLGVAVRVDVDSLPLRDFHTFQRADAGTGRNRTNFYTRREELLHDKIGTGLSTRDYRTDALYTVCLWKTHSSQPSLEAITSQFRTPHFHLYAGRKSCPLGLPIRGVLVEAASIRDAFKIAILPDEELLESTKPDKEAMPVLDRLRLQRRNQNFTNRYYWQECDFHGFENATKALRRDEPRSRTKWQFGERFEYSAIEDITPLRQPEEPSELRRETSENQLLEDS